jgi:Cft2 family RNA processing exonuclease
MTKEFGFKLLEEMVTQENLTFEYAVFSSDPNENETQRCSLPRLSKDDIQNCSEKITLIELKEVIELPYGVKITPLSSGFSLGSAMWLLESANDKFSYIPAASADLNRHPKELDFAPMIVSCTFSVVFILHNLFFFVFTPGL